MSDTQEQIDELLQQIEGLGQKILELESEPMGDPEQNHLRAERLRQLRGERAAMQRTAISMQVWKLGGIPK